MLSLIAEAGGFNLLKQPDKVCHIVYYFDFNFNFDCWIFGRQMSNYVVGISVFEFLGTRTVGKLNVHIIVINIATDRVHSPAFSMLEWASSIDRSFLETGLLKLQCMLCSFNSPIVIFGNLIFQLAYYLVFRISGFPGFRVSGFLFALSCFPLFLFSGF